MRTFIVSALLLFAGFAFAAPAFAQKCGDCPPDAAKCGGCPTDTAKTEGEHCDSCAKCKEAACKDCPTCKGKDDCDDCPDCKGDTAKQAVYVVEINGMCCANCTKTIQKKFSKIDGVASCTVDFDSGKATVTMKEGKTLDKAACDAALKDSQYEAASCTAQDAPKTDPAPEKKDAATDAPVYVVDIDGMMCGGCVKQVQRRLSKIEGVASCTVDLDSKKATVTMNAGKKLDVDACTAALKGTDYSATACTLQEAKKPESSGDKKDPSDGKEGKN